jgi:hypothetical protein
MAPVHKSAKKDVNGGFWIYRNRALGNWRYTASPGSIQRRKRYWLPLTRLPFRGNETPVSIWQLRLSHSGDQLHSGQGIPAPDHMNRQLLKSAAADTKPNGRVLGNTESVDRPHGFAQVVGFERKANER